MKIEFNKKSEFTENLLYISSNNGMAFLEVCFDVYKQFIQKSAFKKIVFLNFKIEIDNAIPGYEIHFTILGLCFYFRYNKTSSEIFYDNIEKEINEHIKNKKIMELN